MPELPVRLEGMLTLYLSDKNREEGHQARDCEKPKNPMNFQCKNCDEGN
jgi:hypothetical protein